MPQGGKTLFAILMVLVLVTGANGMAPDSADSPYQAIVERNVFGLRPLVVDTNVVVAPPAGKITLTGITTILGKKQALMSVQVPGKPQPQLLMLTEGQRDGEIEVQEISEAAGTVKVTNQGVTQLLDFKSDGAKLQAALPGIPPPGSLVIPPPPRTIPTRTMRLPPPNTGAAQMPTAPANAPGIPLPPPPPQ